MQESVKNQAVEVKEVEVKEVEEVSREQVAFYAFVRKRSADYIEHVLNCVGYGEFDKVPSSDGTPVYPIDRIPAFEFIKHSLLRAWLHASLVPDSHAKEWLEEYHKNAERNLKWAKAYHFTRSCCITQDKPLK